MPRMLQLAQKLWESLREDPNCKGAPGVLGVFEGSMSEVYKRTQASMTHYTKLYQLLQEMGCIVVERRGRRDVTSRVILLTAPTEELYERHSQAVENRLTRSDGAAILHLSQRVTAIEGRLEGIDLKTALVNFETRLQKLEGKLDAT